MLWRRIKDFCTSCFSFVATVVCLAIWVWFSACLIPISIFLAPLRILQTQLYPLFLKDVFPSRLAFVRSVERFSLTYLVPSSSTPSSTLAASTLFWVGVEFRAVHDALELRRRELDKISKKRWEKLESHPLYDLHLASAVAAWTELHDEPPPTRLARALALTDECWVASPANAAIIQTALLHPHLHPYDLSLPILIKLAQLLLPAIWQLGCTFTTQISSPASVLARLDCLYKLGRLTRGHDMFGWRWSPLPPSPPTPNLSLDPLSKFKHALRELTQDNKGEASYWLMNVTRALIPLTAEIQKLAKEEVAILERFEDPLLELLHRWRELKDVSKNLRRS